ncbi:MAG: hypothetical protein ACI9QQ_000785 [Myxococcota bacterium]|jgi:hypothetical protein
MRSLQTFASSLLSVVIALGAGAVSAQIADPVPGTIPTSALSLVVEEVVQLPSTGPAHRPVARPMTLVGDGTGRRFIADQNGTVYQLHDDTALTVFLDLNAASNLVRSSGQQGLTSIAFHPDYHAVGAAGEGKFYTASSQTVASGTPDYPVPMGAPETHHSVLHEWHVSGDPDVIDANSTREVLRIGQMYSDHNLGQIAFNSHISSGQADYGMLFMAVGDGGNVGSPRPTIDPYFMGQDLSHPLGSMLRIDPLEPGGGPAYTAPGDNPFAADADPGTLAEIWAYGLRNPHRFSWDSGGVGRMYIGDIGQANIEEINVGSVGANFGWSEREGTFSVVHTNEQDVFALPGNDETFGYTYPVAQYDHDENDRAISGGYVVRGRNSDLEGHYLFGDLRSGRVFHVPAANLDGSGQAAFSVLSLIDAADSQEKSLLSMIGGGSPAPRADLRFGRDDMGQIYLLTKRDGKVRQFQLGAVAVPTMDGLGLFGLTLAFAATAGLARLRRS